MWTSEADTQAFANALAACPSVAHATIALHGDLGAGKTTFVRHLLRALGVRGRIKSPTYAVVEPHTAIDCPLMPAGEALSIWHFDFYRFNDAREWEDAGFRELFASPGLKLVEWPERAEAVLPPLDLRLTIEPGPSSSASMPLDLADEPAEPWLLTVAAHTAVGQCLLQALA